LLKASRPGGEFQSTIRKQREKAIEEQETNPKHLVEILVNDAIG
jgi:hypothetical protein